MKTVTVIKRNLQHQEVWRYSGKLIFRSAETLILEAAFNRPDTPFYGILIKQGDIFIEVYHTQRWYNIFEMRDRDDGHLKGWYCNVGYPLRIEQEEADQITISYVDLALDLLVYPDGQQRVLDEDEFGKLELPAEVEASARSALAELQAIFRKHNGAGFVPAPRGRSPAKAGSISSASDAASRGSASELPNMSSC